MFKLISEFHTFVLESLAAVKTKMLQILISCLYISSALAASYDDCKVGDVNFTGFDIDNVRDSDVCDFHDSLEHNACVCDGKNGASLSNCQGCS